MAEEDFQLPEFPALHQALILEARHSSRLRIVKDLSSTNLFENMIEAKSLDDAQSSLVLLNYDACFLGPSITPKKASEFIVKGLEAAKSEDCAFLAFVNRLDLDGESAQEEIVGPLLDAGVHNIIELPCMKTFMKEEVVKGIVASNANHPWAGILLDSLGDDPGVLERFGIKIGGEISKKASRIKKAQLQAMLQDTVEGLKELAHGTEMGRYGLTQEGLPTKKTVDLLKEITEKMLSGFNKNETSELKETFESALTRWLVDLVKEDQHVANKHLQETLMSFSD